MDQIITMQQHLKNSSMAKQQTITNGPRGASESGELQLGFRWVLTFGCFWEPKQRVVLAKLPQKCF